MTLEQLHRYSALSRVELTLAAVTALVAGFELEAWKGWIWLGFNGILAIYAIPLFVLLYYRARWRRSEALAVIYWRYIIDQSKKDNRYRQGIPWIRWLDTPLLCAAGVAAGLAVQPAVILVMRLARNIHWERASLRDINHVLAQQDQHP